MHKPCIQLYGIFTARKRILRRLCFYTCVSVHRGLGGIPACIAGGISACLAAGLRGRGVVSQHALQVSRPTPRGELRGLARGVVSRPTPKGEVEGSGLGGLLPGGWCLLQGVPAPGGGGGSAPGGGEPPPTPPPEIANAVGGTHPTGMHSCRI